jgi:hypothetical protein
LQLWRKCIRKLFPTRFLSNLISYLDATVFFLLHDSVCPRLQYYSIIYSHWTLPPLTNIFEIWVMCVSKKKINFFQLLIVSEKKKSSTFFFLHKYVILLLSSVLFCCHYFVYGSLLHEIQHLSQSTRTSTIDWICINSQNLVSCCRWNNPFLHIKGKWRRKKNLGVFAFYANVLCCFFFFCQIKISTEKTHSLCRATETE